HAEIDPEAFLQPAIEVDEMRIGVVQERARWHEPERHRKPATERFDEATMAVSGPERTEVRHLPALASGPLQGRQAHGTLRRGPCHLVIWSIWSFTSRRP